MFIKVKRISHDSYGKEYERETIINTDLIASVKVMVLEPEENTEFKAHVYQTTGTRIVLDKENYDLLVKALVK